MKKKYTYFIIIFLIASSCASFGRIAGNDFINFDEIAYITENNHIKSGINTESVKWAFTTTHFGFWHPIAWLSHMLDWNLFGANASGHHLINLFLHIGAGIFLFLFLYKTTKNIWPAAFATAFFALHPLRVESVAWAAERKDVLSMFFGMTSIYTYAFYVESSKLSKYFLCLILFALALMSKPMIVTLPFVLMLLDYWPFKRWQKEMVEPTKNKLTIVEKLILEKIPFILLTIAFSILAFWTQYKSEALVPIDSLTILERVANTIFSYIAYVEKILWPFNLAVYYPYDYSLPLWKVLISAIILIAITSAVLYYIRKLPFLFVGWFWYLGTLVPLIGLIQAGQQAMTDRHTYLPSIGIAIMLAWSIPLLFQKLEIRKNILFLMAIAVLCTLAFLTWMQCGYWKNSITLFSHALKVTKDNYLIHNNLGLTLSREGKDEEAIYHYNKAIYIRPKFFDAYLNKGIANFKLGQYQMAIKDFNEAIRLKPDYVDAYFNRGTTYANLSQNQLAIENYNAAIRLKPDYAAAYNNRGIAYFRQSNKNLGCRDAQKTCALGICKLLELANSKGLCR